MPAQALSANDTESLLSTIKTAVRHAANQEAAAGTSDVDSSVPVDNAQPSLPTALAALLQVNRVVSRRKSSPPAAWTPSATLEREVIRHDTIISESVPRLRAAVEQLQVCAHPALSDLSP